jgi:hypothetical protein
MPDTALSDWENFQWHIPELSFLAKGISVIGNFESGHNLFPVSVQIVSRYWPGHASIFRIIIQDQGNQIGCRAVLLDP